MKKINYYLGAMALATLGLAACSNNDLPENNLERTDIERDMYINIAIHGDNPNASRGLDENGNLESVDFADGTGLESDVSNVYLVFYDAVGNVVGDVVTANPSWGTVTSTNPSVEKVGTETLKVTLAVGQQQPSYVMCYINPTSKDNLLKPLNDLATTSVETVTNPDKTLPMSNSVYFDEGGNTVTATPIAGKYYSTKALADAAAAKGESVDIYVERYAAKLQLKTLGTISDYKTGTMPAAALQGTPGAQMLDVTLTFAPTGWEVNGISKNSYIIKSFRKESDNGQVLPDVYTYDEMNNRINGLYSLTNGTLTLGNPLTGTAAWTWNASESYRSYWGCSPVYFQSIYPEVNSDYNPDTMAQTFYSYEYITGKNNAYNTDYYYPETTVGARGLFSANPNAAVASVVVVGEYSIKVGETAVPAKSTFYTYVPVNIQVGETADETEQHASVYFEVATDGNKIGTSAVDGTLSMQNRFLWQNTVLYHNVDGTNVRYNMSQDTDVETLVGNTEIARPKATVLAMAVVGEGTVKMAERTRTLQLKESAITDGILINDNGVIKSIVSNDVTNPTATQVTLDRANLILWQNVGTCNKYDGGAGFFNIPVKHLGWYRGGNTQKNAPKIDFAQVRVGDLGMVRNHAYTVQVNSISGLASGIGSQENPIIPPAETQDVYVSYRVNVLKWAVVPTQTVDL